MEFKLLYSGQLFGASKTDTRAKHKHSIRQAFHPQLRQLWKTKYQLHTMAERYVADSQYNDPSKSSFDRGIEYLSSHWRREGFSFLPLVAEDSMLRCSIGILLLRPSAEKVVIHEADMDAKLKTLFDALRIPVNSHETGGVGPEEDESPFYCLLSDDKLITDVSVETDELLQLPQERELKPNDAFAVITVKLKPTRRSMYSWVFE